MISIVALIHNSRRTAVDCLQSVLLATQALRLDPREAEYVLLDDHSDEQAEIPALFRDFRKATQSQTQMFRFRRHCHYAYGVALGLSLARGQSVLFVSHDMIIPPACLQALLEVAAMHPDAGIIRPRSQHMDGATELQLVPPLRLRTMDDVGAFSRLVRQRYGGEIGEPWMCIGDAMLVKRAVLDRIGVFDTRFFGYMADIDFGLRAERAGFKAIIAHGAWLHHVGDAVTKEVELAGGDSRAVQEKTRAEVAGAYVRLREKWSDQLPENWMSVGAANFEKLLALPRGPMDEMQPPLQLDAELCEVIQ